MGYASGSELMGKIVKSLVANATNWHVAEHQLYPVFLSLISAFEEMDCDTLDECYGICGTLDKALDDTGWAPED